MVFSSISFLFYFLPITLIVYYLVPRKWINGKNAVLLAASLFFYFYGEQLLVLVMLGSSFVDYVCSIVIEKYRENKVIPKIALAISLTASLALLGYFKYFNFFTDNFTNLFGMQSIAFRVMLPIGISFYTFQTMSYTIDVYKGQLKAQRNPLTYITFVTMFPQLVAGPIVRYTEVEKELVDRRNNFPDFADGAKRFVIGLAKKVLIANMVAEMAYILAGSGEVTVLSAWLIQLAFFFQIYFDFSGYSDMAIGLAKMFGLKFPENFNYPYIARSISDFWRRWHMTLTRWFRDYIYIPLGGNRGSKFKVIRNIFIVWFITGFWHGAAWNFILWGLYFAVILMFEKFILGRHIEKVPRVIRHAYVLTLVFFGFVMFNADNFGEVLTNLGSMFGAGGIALTGAQSLYYLRSYAFVFVLAIIGSTPLLRNLCVRINNTKHGRRTFNVLEPLMILVLLVWCAAMLVDGSFNPFIYFRF